MGDMLQTGDAAARTMRFCMITGNGQRPLTFPQEPPGAPSVATCNLMPHSRTHVMFARVDPCNFCRRTPFGARAPTSPRLPLPCNPRAWPPWHQRSAPQHIAMDKGPPGGPPDSPNFVSATAQTLASQRRRPKPRASWCRHRPSWKASKTPGPLRGCEKGGWCS